MKILFSILITTIIVIVTNTADAQKLRLQTPDSTNGRPTWQSYIFFKMKLNGVYDISGGLQGSETFNLNKIDVWGTDNTPNFWMDMHQSQIRLFGSHEIGKHQAIGYFEGDFWGGSNKMRLRMAYINYKFFQFGQDWSFFGDKEIWPNVFDWDGPSSGIWRRDPFLQFYFWTENDWKFEFGIEAPGAQISYIDNLDSTFMNASGNPIPDFIATIKKKTSWGHIRLAGIARWLPYRENGNLNFVNGYGGALSGYIKTGKKYHNPIQFQIVYGTGIATYVVSFDGANYDAMTDGYGNMKSVPVVGGWISYEHWFNDFIHVNFVGGLTDFISPQLSSLEVPEGGFIVTDGHINLDFYYGLVNFMVDPFENFTVGLEFNYGNRDNKYTGIEYPVRQILSSENSHSQSRSATRISFGLFYDF